MRESDSARRGRRFVWQVPRTRFAPVKTTADLLALRSDVYEVTPDHRLQVYCPQHCCLPVASSDSPSCAP